MFTALFLKATAERALKTFAQTAVALFVAGAGLLSVDWLAVLSVAGLATVASVLTSIGSGFVGDATPSLVATAEPTPGDHVAP